VFTARYALSPYIKQMRSMFKGLNKAVYTLSLRLMVNHASPEKHTDVHSFFFSVTVPVVLEFLQCPFVFFHTALLMQSIFYKTLVACFGGYVLCQRSPYVPFTCTPRLSEFQI
jgi:hypothetical protein